MPTSRATETAATRARILRAASGIVTGGARLTVRAVAARASVSIGTLRYHFPTQRELLDAVLSAVYESAMPDERIRDAAIPPRERLLECLRHLLAPIGVDREARETWRDIYRAYIDPEVGADVRAGYLELSRHAHRRVESWLAILVEEGSIRPGDNAARARLLLVVVNGLAVQRALPAEAAPLELETEALDAAVDALLVNG